MHMVIERLLTHDNVCSYENLSSISRYPGELDLNERDGGREELPYWGSSVQIVTLI